MKRCFLMILTVVVFAAGLSFFAYADEPGTGYVTIAEDMNKEEIAESILGFINTFEGDLPREVTEADIDFSGAYKIYVDTNVFEFVDSSFTKMTETLEQTSTIIFNVPIFLENGDVYVANIQRSLPLKETVREVLTEEEIADYEQTVGKWVVSAMFQYLAEDAPFTDYYEIVKDGISATGTSPIFVGSLPYFRNAVALFPDENGNVGRLIPINPPAFVWENLDEFKDEYSENGWLKYSRVQDYVKKHAMEEKPELSGGGLGGAIDADAINTSFSWWITIAGFTAFFGLIGVFAIRKRKANR